MYNPNFGGYQTPLNSYQPRMNNFETASVIRVNGLNGANSYNLAPNSSVLLLDETSPIVYLKITDGAGYGTITAYDITPHKTPETINIEDRLLALEGKISSMEVLLNGQPNSTAANTPKQSKSTK